MIALALTVLFTLPILALLRWIVSLRITALMGRASPTAGDPLATFAETPEVPMSTVPRIEILDATSVPQAASEARAAAARTARKMFGKWWRTEALAVIGYMVLIGAALFAVASTPAQTGFSMMLIPVGYLLVVTLRYFFWFRQYTSVRGGGRFRAFLRFIGMMILALPRVLVHPGNAWLPFSLCAVGVIVTGGGYLDSVRADDVTGGLVVLAACVLGVGLHVSLLLRFRASMPDAQAPNVAMLRVFGIDKNAYFTFGSMLDSWRHFGPSFTIIDPAFFRYRYRSLSAENVGMVLWLSSLIGLAIAFGMNTEDIARTFANGEVDANLAGLKIQAASGFITALILTIGYTIRMFWYLVALPSHFVKDTAQIEARMAEIEKRPRNFDMTFRNVHMFCHDNTWRVAVDEFVGRADVVLMDLRGYTTERQGCEYEVDFLFDKAPLGRVLFLIDQKTDVDAVGALIRDRWAELRVTSPNLSDPDPVARVYRTGGAAKSDVRGLLDLMFAGATHQADDSAPVAVAA